MAACPGGDGARMVCWCLKVTEARLLWLLKDPRYHSLEAIAEGCGAGEGCMACHPRLCAFLKRAEGA